MRTTNLTIIDYVTFVAALFVTLAVPIYSGYKPRRDDTKKNFVFATGGKISMGMMILSMLRGILGVRMFLGKMSNFVLIFQQGKNENLFFLYIYFVRKSLGNVLQRHENVRSRLFDHVDVPLGFILFHTGLL